MLLVILQGLTLKDVIDDLPHDTSAFIVYTLLLLFIASIWYGSRSGRSRKAAADLTAAAEKDKVKGIR
jgi:hypothetical protein